MASRLGKNIFQTKRYCEKNLCINYSLADDGEYDFGDIWDDAIKQEDEMKNYTPINKKKNIFDKARQKTKDKYQNLTTENYEKAKSNELHDIKDINHLEKNASKGFKNSIQCKTKCFWKYILTDDGRTAFGTGIGIFAMTLFIHIYSIDDLSPKMWFYNILKDLFVTAFYCFIILTISFVLSLIKRNARSKSRVFFISWLVTFVLCLPYIPILFGYETNQIEDFYEAKNYTAKYYVIMSREPNSVHNRKAYTLPAEIERRLEDEEKTFRSFTYYLDGETSERYVSVPYYHINYLYFPNGGYLTFTYDEAYENPDYTSLLLNEETMVTDYHGDEYYITLTNKKVE